MKTNTFTATNEGQGIKLVPVTFAPETSVRIAVSRQMPALPWIPLKPAAPVEAPRPSLTLVVALPGSVAV